MFPSIETSRLLLRPRTLDDTDACLEMDRDPAVTRFVIGPWSDPVAHRDFIRARTIGPYGRGLGYWTIGWRERPMVFLGWVLLIPVDGAGPEIEIGWRLCQAVWRQGIASEAAATVLDYAFVTLRLPEVIAEIHPDNAASRRVAERLGLKRRCVVCAEGHAAVRYSLTLREFGGVR
jgi:RimJ/RimL family protein N-acetyltransferase